MRSAILFMFFLLLVAVSSSQKRNINIDTYKNWERLTDYGISNDGMYAWYNYASKERSSVLIIKSLSDKWEYVLKGAFNGQFTSDSKNFVFCTDSAVGIFYMATRKIRYILNGTSFELPKEVGNKWVICKRNNGLTLFDISTERKISYEGTKEWQCSNNGKSLLINNGDTLLLLQLQTGSKKIMARGEGIRYPCFDKSGNNFCFIKIVKQEAQIYYYNLEADTTLLVISNSSPGITPEYKLSDKMPTKFSEDGQRLFFKLEKRPLSMPLDSDIITPHVNIWSYRDRYLQAHQKNLFDELKDRPFSAVFTFNSKKIVQLENDDSSLVGNPNNNYAIIRKLTNENESYWAVEEFPSCQLVSLADGARSTCVKEESKSVNVSISPNEQFVISYDTISKHYYSYEIKTQILRNITADLGVPQAAYENGRVMHYQYNIEGWVHNNTYILLQDQYDIWEVDPTGQRKPIVLTGKYGRKTGTILRSGISKDLLRQMHDGDSLILVGLVDSNKYNGFFKVQLGKSAAPNQICLDPCLYYFPGIFIPETPRLPIKADNANVFILQKQSDTIAPNLIVTSDFKRFTHITNLAPQRIWNWITAELVHWNTYDGHKRMGILYKPENFDPTKKYPIIFHYYQIRSNERFKFLRPSLSHGDLNIPLYVSNGYLVFVPDIHMHTAYTGESALNSITSAADYLTSHYSWVDKTKMGLQGHSFGGFVTNYVITHSSYFAAAQSSAGRSDLVSSYGGLGFGNESLSYITEVGQTDMGNTPWDQPYLYIKNSPIFFANKVQTPLLLMHNPNDGIVSMSQSIEFFTALRRLRKPVWLLEYDGGGHILDLDQLESLDFTIRQKQFFDYFLKRTPAPIWIKRNIPFRLKGIVSGLHTDSVSTTY